MEILDEKITSATAVNPKDLDGAGGILAMGIISIPFFGGIIGLILSIITLNRSSKALALYNENPENYTESSVKKVRAGRICSIVSLSLLGLSILLILIITSLN